MRQELMHYNVAEYRLRATNASSSEGRLFPADFEWRFSGGGLVKRRVNRTDGTERMYGTGRGAGTTDDHSRDSGSSQSHLRVAAQD